MAGSAAAMQYARINSAITSMGDVDDLVVTTPDPEPELEPADSRSGRPLNILIMGTDDRSGANADIGGYVAGAPLSDTTILAHISADRTRVDLISIARDTRAEIPACNRTLQPGENLSRPKVDKFNAAFSTGSSGACLRQKQPNSARCRLHAIHGKLA